MLDDRFWSKVDMNPHHCWEWQAGKNQYGYGRYWHDGKLRAAHRVSFEHFNGYLSSKLDVLHKCDNPSCVNPDHLRLGTHQDNMDDRGAKGRTRTRFSDVTHCIRGHEFTEENTYYALSTNWRQCRICKAEGQRVRRGKGVTGG